MNPQAELFAEEKPFSPRANQGSAEQKHCVFCDIAQGKAKALIVFEDDTHIVFLDRRPLNHGHCLVVPKKHFHTTNDIDASAFANLMLLSRQIVSAVELAMDADGSFLAINNVISQSVPHLHVHAVPRFEKDSLFSHNLAWHRKPYRDDQQMQEVAQSIRSALSRVK